MIFWQKYHFFTKWKKILPLLHEKYQNILSDHQMKNTLYLIFFISLAACTPRQQGSVIEGTLPNDLYDNESVYWVPMKGDHPRPVDSTIIKKNKFRIVISDHNLNKTGIIRVKPVLRLALQEILVFTEPGKIYVKLDSLSSSSGTPLNDVFQVWKDRKQKYNRDRYELIQKRNKKKDNDQDIQKEKLEKLFDAYLDDIYLIVYENKDNEAGKFIFSMHKSSFTLEQQNELGIE